MARRAGVHSTKSARRISRGSCASAAMPGRSYRKRTRSASTMYIAAESSNRVEEEGACPRACSLWMPSPLPADPVANSAAHDELEITPAEPRQLLGEQCHALTPWARHARDV